MSLRNSGVGWLWMGLLAAGCSVFALSGSRERAVGEEAKEGCVEAAAGPIGPPAASGATAATRTASGAVVAPLARVGHKAPDFEASGYVGGKFKNIKLSDAKGKWVVLCFYPGDFTFV